jgi:hypothetical protein
MFSGGDYEEVGRWLRNFVLSHAKRENPRAEAVVDMEGPHEGQSYGVRVRLGAHVMPPLEQPPLTLPFLEVADQRGGLHWCNTLAARVRALVRAGTEAHQGSQRSA